MRARLRQPQRLMAFLGAGVLLWTAAAHASPPSAPAAHRVIALAPHIVELVFAAGAGEALVATVDGSNFPPAAQAIPSLGDGLRLSAESVLLLQPDLIIAWQSGPVRTLAPLLDRYGIDLLFSDPKRLHDIPDQITLLGQRLGTAAIASATAERLRHRIDTLADRYAGQTPVRVFVQLGTAPIFSLGAASIVNDALRVCGAVNVLGDTRLVAPQVSVEGVVAAAPDLILTGTPDGQADLPVRAFWNKQGWPARRSTASHFVALPADALFRPTPRMIDATESLCQQVDAVRHAL